jgi:hypothetical protein
MDRHRLDARQGTEPRAGGRWCMSRAALGGSPPPISRRCWNGAPAYGPRCSRPCTNS